TSLRHPIGERHGKVPNRFRRRHRAHRPSHPRRARGRAGMEGRLDRERALDAGGDLHQHRGHARGRLPGRARGRSRQGEGRGGGPTSPRRASRCRRARTCVETVSADMIRMLIRFAALAAVALLAACAFAPKETFVKAAYDYNLAVEESQNQMLLLNVVRASKRHPMYFTAISAMRGNITSSAGFGDSSIPVGGGSASAGTIAPNASYSANPSFDLAVLDSKSFTRGILTPVPVETFQYYWDQGWPKELLLNLFVASIKEDEG